MHLITLILLPPLFLVPSMQMYGQVWRAKEIPHEAEGGIFIGLYEVNSRLNLLGD